MVVVVITLLGSWRSADRLMTNDVFDANEDDDDNMTNGDGEDGQLP